jgi:hypothetical protein
MAEEDVVRMEPSGDEPLKSARRTKKRSDKEKTTRLAVL